MAIAFDASSSSSVNPSTQLTYAHTCAGANRILFVGIQTGSDSGTTDITSVTYGGVAMTQVNVQTITGADDHLYLYRLVAPNTGANNIVINKTNSGFIASFAASYTGVRQTGQPEANTTSSGADPKTFNLTTVSANAWIVLTATCSSGTLSFTGGGTVRTGTTRIIGDRGPFVSPGSQSIVVDDSVSETVWGNLAAFAPTTETSESDTVSTSDSASAVFTAALTESVTLSETTEAKYGYSKLNKSSSTWNNTDKS